ncbi:MAG: hypothetical protein V4603_12020 [Pseudomonadota bacterium]
MFTSRQVRSAICAAGTASLLGLGLGLSANALAEIKVDPCAAQAKVLSQTQTEQGIDLEVEITVADCKGTCTGSIEYSMVFTDANDNAIQWQKTGTWDWRSVDAPFTLKLHEKPLPNATFKEIKALKIGRCSCSTVISS